MRVIRYGNIKPPQGARIDWSHPLACDLHCAWLFGPGANAQGGMTAWPPWAASIGLANGSHSCYVGGTSVLANAQLWEMWTPTPIPYTVHWVGMTTSTSNQNVFVDATNNTGILVAINPATYGLAAYVYSNGWQSNSVPATVNCPYSAAASFATNSQRLAVNGRCATTSWEMNAHAQGYVHIGSWTSGADAFVGHWALFAIYRGEKPLTALEWLSVEPYAMWFTERPVTYSIPAGGTFNPAWARQHNIFLGGGIR